MNAGAISLKTFLSGRRIKQAKKATLNTIESKNQWREGFLGCALMGAGQTTNCSAFVSKFTWAAATAIVTSSITSTVEEFSSETWPFELGGL